MTYEILLIVVIGRRWLHHRQLPERFPVCRLLGVVAALPGQIPTPSASFQVPLLRNGFRLVVFSVIIMVVVLFFRKGIMGERELPDLSARKRKGKEAAK